jgi:phage major head subunit gpT-like protein
MSLYEYDKLPTTSGEAIREFNDKYLAAQGVVLPPGWVDQYGDGSPVSSPKVTFPISQLSGAYKETKGDSKFKTMKETSFDVKVLEFDMGYRAKLIDLFQNVYAYKKWGQAAQRFMVAEANHRAESIATLLEDGENTACWDGVNFFSTTHPACFGDSAAGTFSNYQASTKDPADIADLEEEITLMRGVKDENGKKLGVEPDTILLPTEKFQKVVNVLKQDLIASTATPGAGTTTIKNPLIGMLNVVHVPQFTDVNDFFLVDSKLVSQLPPWAALRYAPPTTLGLRTWDESSDYFKDTGNLKVSSHIWYGFAMVFPHAIRKVAGA